MQLSELREYASRRGWTITSEYVDHGVSGSKKSRPQLNQHMADAHRRKFDAVLGWKIDRFGRSLKHLVNALAELGAYGRLCQLPRQPRFQHSIRATHVPDHRQPWPSLSSRRSRRGYALACETHGRRARNSEGSVLRLTLLEWPSCAVTGFRGLRSV